MRVKCAERFDIEDCIVLKVRPLCVSDTTTDYTYQDSEEASLFYRNLLDDNEPNQECVWNKQNEYTSRDECGATVPV